MLLYESFIAIISFLHSIKLSGYKMGMKVKKYPLAVEQNN